jgi:putative heme iron utilization protein
MTKRLKMVGKERLSLPFPEESGDVVVKIFVKKRDHIRK